MPKTYLCAVSSRFPENYDIGVLNRVWGVEEKYARRLAAVTEGDQILFVVGGAFRSLHRVESVPFFDQAVLWPEKNGSFFPHRVRIGPPLFVGDIPVKELADQISFMRQARQWGGTIRGPNGVLNPRMTAEDVGLVVRCMTPRIERARTRAPRVASRRPFTFTLSVDAFTNEVKQALRQVGLEAVHVQPREDGRGLVLHLARRGSDDQVVAGVFVDAPRTDDVVAVLREMISLRTRLPDKAHVDGLLLSLVDDPELEELVGETRSVKLMRYGLGVRLAAGDHGAT